MNKEIGQMESELHSIEMRACDMMSDNQKAEAVRAMAIALLVMNERLKELEEVVSYIDENTRLDI
jgi:gamma-glutamyl:cysteine ligase YbdK (ATP-grasp superfamily)